MDDDGWRPHCAPARDLVRPVRRDEHGKDGPTRHQARRGRWRQTTYGFYVPSGTDRTKVEQRILEQSMRVGDRGAVTGWAALRVWGAAFFDGLAPDGRTELPVALVSPTHLADTGASTCARSRLPDGTVWTIRGIRVVTPARALFDEIRARGELREAVVAIDMACAAPVTSLARFGGWLDGHRGPGTTLAVSALGLASEHSLSPMKVPMRMTWVLDAGWPQPLVNPDVYSLEGKCLGRPDLLDLASGTAGEYDGAAHRGRARHRRDIDRAERFRAHGLEPFVVVAGDGADLQRARMEAARARALRRPPSEQQWTVEPPSWAVPPWTADETLAMRNLPI